jgi:hypothetical protein
VLAILLIKNIYLPLFKITVLNILENQLSINFLIRMQQFPTIKENEYLVLFADKNTGIVVDQDGEWYIQEAHQQKYTIVSSYDEAEILVKSRLLKQPNLEGEIYNSKYEPVAKVNNPVIYISTDVKKGWFVRWRDMFGCD